MTMDEQLSTFSTWCMTKIEKRGYDVEPVVRVIATVPGGLNSMANDYLVPHLDRAALLVIDVQRDFVDGAMTVPGTAEVLPRLVELASSFRNAGRPVIHIIRIYEPGGSDVDLVRRSIVEEGAEIAAPGTEGSQIPPQLLPGGEPIMLDDEALLAGEVQRISDNEAIIYKPRWSAFYRTSLDALLKDLQVDSVIVAGCNLPNCPRATLFDASERDLRTVVVTDAVSQATPERLADLQMIGVNLMTTEELVDALGQESSRGDF